ncbi:MAG: phosphopantetheine-binding protein [Myxococcota bacterium]|nr:phosphopantetheine-binding protein [Myxococcota bacterium]
MKAPLDLLNEVESIVREAGHLSEPIPPSQDLYREVGIQSVNSINILLLLEERFVVSLADDSFMRARTLNQLADLILESKAA